MPTGHILTMFIVMNIIGIIVNLILEMQNISWGTSWNIMVFERGWGVGTMSKHF